MCLEKEMATHSSVLAWRIPRTGEPGGLQSMGSLTVRHDWATSLSLFTFTHWRKKWQPTPAFLPGESQGQGSLVGSMGSHRGRHDWSDLAAAAACVVASECDGSWNGFYFFFLALWYNCKIRLLTWHTKDVFRSKIRTTASVSNYAR